MMHRVNPHTVATAVFLRKRGWVRRQRARRRYYLNLTTGQEARSMYEAERMEHTPKPPRRPIAQDLLCIV